MAQGLKLTQTAYNRLKRNYNFRVTDARKYKAAKAMDLGKDGKLAEWERIALASGGIKTTLRGAARKGRK